MAANSLQVSGQNRRFAAAGLVVVLVAVSVWLFGRPDPPEPTVQVVAAAEDWPAGREPGGFVTVEMPEAAAGLFVTPDELEGRVPATAVPAGAVVSAAVLTDPGTGFASDLSSTLLAVRVDPSLWPDPGPQPGDAAVLATEPGGCATAVLPMLVVGEESVVVEARPQLAAVLGPEVWWIWQSPPAGWPACSAAAAARNEGRSDRVDGLG